MKVSWISSGFNLDTRHHHIANKLKNNCSSTFILPSLISGLYKVVHVVVDTVVFVWSAVSGLQEMQFIKIHILLRSTCKHLNCQFTIKMLTSNCRTPTSSAPFFSNSSPLDFIDLKLLHQQDEQFHMWWHLIWKGQKDFESVFNNRILQPWCCIRRCATASLKDFFWLFLHGNKYQHNNTKDGGGRRDVNKREEERRRKSVEQDERRRRGECERKSRRKEKERGVSRDERRRRRTRDENMLMKNGRGTRSRCKTARQYTSWINE